MIIVSKTHECGNYLIEIRCNQRETMLLTDFINYMNGLQNMNELKEKLAEEMEIEL